MRFRQVHLDFHTSELIPNIGSQFTKSQFQEILKLGHVDSITVFSKCHHGWAYHPSVANQVHPHLSFDLLAAQIEAAHEIDVRTPVYLSAGLDEKVARERPDWLVRRRENTDDWKNSFLQPGYHLLCMNTPYLDILAAQVEEVVLNYDADGIFLDIVSARYCQCNHCIATLMAEGKDPRDTANVLELGERVHATYVRRINEAVHKHKPHLTVFHNGGHIIRGRRDLAHMNTHLELESLPTGGWGYDHFPLSARYASTLGMDFLGMTGKFHTSWGEFGGYKHPNALRYEAGLTIANGARMSIGDQLHPGGALDPATYALIGAAYAEVELKEAYCENSVNVADVALLSVEAAATAANRSADRFEKSDAGAVRMLLEGKFLFDVIDTQQDLSAYKVLVLPDGIVVDESLKAKIDTFLAAGGKVLATGESGLNPARDSFAIDLGAKYIGPSEFSPSYFRPHWPLANLGEAAFVFYGAGHNVELNGGTALGHRENPYFNREFDHFCSHQHAPNAPHDAGPGVVESKNGIYIAWNVFADYATKGSLALKEVTIYALNRLLPNKTLTTNLPAQGIVTLTEQPAHNRQVVHLLYASPVKRGDGVEVIEDLLPIMDTSVVLRLSQTVKRVSLAPQGDPIPFEPGVGVVSFTVPRFECHQMVLVDY